MGLALAATACREIVSALGANPAESRARAESLFGAIAARFGSMTPDPTYAALRPRLVRDAFAPSRLFGDRTAWTASADASRTLELRGKPAWSRYTIGVEPGAPPPAAAGDYRATLALDSLGGGVYRWRVRDELSVGRVPADRIADALTRVLLAAELATSDEAAAGVRAAFPRTAWNLGRLIFLDRVEVARDSDAATVTVEASVHPEALAASYPHYAAFLRAHATPFRFALRVGDGADVFWTFETRDDKMRLQLRVHAGNVVPLSGPPRPMPDRLRASCDTSTRSGAFRVGVRDLASDVTLVRAPGEKAFTATFHERPDWQLPFLVQPFLKGPLQQPFKGEGSELTFAVHGDGSGPTLLVRDYRLAVKESWIVRWMGGFVGGTMTEFRKSAEEEADRFTGECLEALRADVLASVD